MVVTLSAELEKELLCIPTVIFGILSLLANIYIIMSISYKKSKLNKRKESDNIRISTPNDTMVMDIIFWMTIGDIGSCIWIILNWLPQAISPILFKWNNISCYILGIWGQFWLVNGPCWHFLIAFCLFFLLIGCPLTKLTHQHLLHIILIYIFCGIITIIPIFHDVYGDYDNAKLIKYIY